MASHAISERHRHRYEVNIGYRDAFEAAGLKMTGVSPDGVLPEIVERDDHPWFIGVQFHPELKSRPFAPASAVRQLHRRGGGAEPAGRERWPRGWLTVSDQVPPPWRSALARTRSRPITMASRLFACAGKIFCTLRSRAAAPDGQARSPRTSTTSAEAHPGVIEPVPGYWGRKGSTFVRYDLIDEALASTLLQRGLDQGGAQD